MQFNQSTSDKREFTTFDLQCTILFYIKCIHAEELEVHSILFIDHDVERTCEEIIVGDNLMFQMCSSPYPSPISPAFSIQRNEKAKKI